MADQNSQRCPTCGRRLPARPEPHLPTPSVVAPAASRAEASASGSWWRPLVWSCVLVSCAAIVVAWHRDPGSVLAAVVFVLIAAHRWCSWARARSAVARPGNAGSGKQPHHRE